MPRNNRLGIEAGAPGVDAVLADGGVVRIRPIDPADGDALVHFHEALSFESRYFRFFSPHPTLRPAEIERFTTVDGVNRVALVATERGKLVAVGRYDRLEDPAEAEVAFVVADAHQGRGLGSLLLEHLAAVAATHGITRFAADTLPSNQRMLRVFRDTGFPVKTSIDEGVVHVEFPIGRNERSREVSESREHRAESRSIARLLTPRSIAVIGASRTRDSVGQAVFLNTLRGGFAGPVYPVNPGAGHVASVRAFDSVLDVPGPVDLAVIAVPADAVGGVVEECAAKGVTSLVVLSTGFADAGAEGLAEQERVLRLARSHGMRLVGPNSIGVVNTDPAVAMDATFATYAPTPGVAGLLSQSAALGITMLATAAQSGLGVSSFVSVGNKADVSGNDLLQFWEDDPRTEVILLYLESFGNPRKFGRLARRVGRQKPVIAVKAGGPDVAVEALFHQAGVVRVDTVGQMFDVGRVLAYQPLPAGCRLAIVTNAYGPARMATDAAASAGVDVTDVRDLSLFAVPDDFRRAMHDVLAARSGDVLLVISAPTRAARADAVADAIADAAASAADIPVIATFLAADHEPASLRFGEGRRVPFFRSPEEAVRAMGKAADYAAWRRQPTTITPVDGVDITRARDLVARVLVEHVEQVEQNDLDLELEHDVAVELLAAFGVIIGSPTTDADTDVLLHASITHDPAFGAVVGLAMGGRAAELLGDSVHRAVPLTDHDAGDLWRRLRTAPLLTGYGGSEAVATDALEDVLRRLGVLADSLPEIVELTVSLSATPADAIAYSPRVRIATDTGPAVDEIRRLR